MNSEDIALKKIAEWIHETHSHDPWDRSIEVALFDLCRISDDDAAVIARALAQQREVSPLLREAYRQWQLGIESGRFSPPLT